MGVEVVGVYKSIHSFFPDIFIHTAFHYFSPLSLSLSIYLSIYLLSSTLFLFLSLFHVLSILSLSLALHMNMLF